MTSYIIKALAMWCICFLCISCSTGLEESSVTSCDNNNISNMVAYYEDAIDRAVRNNDCEALLESDSLVNDFVSQNYNCLVIYFVLTDDTIETDREAEDHIDGIIENLSALSYQCAVEESPELN